MCFSFKRKKFWYLTGGILIVGGLIFCFIYFDLRTTFRTFAENTLEPWLKGHPVLGPVAFMLVYIAAVIVFMAGSVMTLVGGAAFGPIWGFIYVSFASIIGAALSFLVARYIARDWIEQKAGNLLLKVQKGIEEEGAKFIVTTRLIPLFPFNLLNYAFGLTRIKFWTYVLLSWVCMIPGTFAYVYTGHAGKLILAGGISLKQGVMIGGSAVALLVLISMLTRWFKSRHEETLEEVEEVEVHNDQSNDVTSSEEEGTAGQTET